MSFENLVSFVDGNGNSYEVAPRPAQRRVDLRMWELS